MSSQTPRGEGTGRVGIVENWELRGSHKQDANSGAFKGLAFVAVAIILLVIGGWFAARPMLGPALTTLFEDSPGIVRLPVVADLLAAELAERLDAPAGSGDQEIAFVVEALPTLDSVQEALVTRGLLTDTIAFRYAMVSNRVDELLEPGVYTMTPQITPAGIATRLAADPDPPVAVTVLDMRHGRRIEQHVAYLQQQTEKTDLELDPKEFSRLARNPGSQVVDQYSFLKQVPDGNSLEGYLSGGTYEVPVDISGEELIYQMLDEWEENSGQYVAQARKKDADFYDTLIVASLVEREAKVDSDRAKIAGVYWNRLNPKVNKQTNGLLQADPTVVYATDSMALEDINVKKWDEYLFWDLLGLSDYSTVNVDKKYQSFQTYQNTGLPDWPIVTPSAKSIEAALNPATKAKNLYFYACPGSDTHKFAKVFKAHQRNINKCN
jgi:UPF0755 protein